MDRDFADIASEERKERRRRRKTKAKEQERQEEDALTWLLIAEVFEQQPSIEEYKAALDECPELGWLAKCARISPLPTGWRKVSSDSTSKEAIAARSAAPSCALLFLNAKTAEVTARSPCLDSFTKLARLAVHARRHADERAMAVAWVGALADGFMAEATELGEGWTGPHHDPATEKEYYHQPSTGVSDWWNPSAPLAFAGVVAQRLLESAAFLSGAAQRDFKDKAEMGIPSKVPALTMAELCDVEPQEEPAPVVEAEVAAAVAAEETAQQEEPQSKEELVDSALAMANTQRLLQELLSRGHRLPGLLAMESALAAKGDEELEVAKEETCSTTAPAATEDDLPAADESLTLPEEKDKALSTLEPRPTRPRSRTRRSRIDVPKIVVSQAGPTPQTTSRSERPTARTELETARSERTVRGCPFSIDGELRAPDFLPPVRIRRRSEVRSSSCTGFRTRPAEQLELESSRELPCRAAIAVF